MPTLRSVGHWMVTGHVFDTLCYAQGTFDYIHIAGPVGFVALMTH